MGVRVLVCGGRDYTDAAAVETHLNELHSENTISLVIQGEARGADRLAKAWAVGRGIETLDCPANWGLYGKQAGYIRNSYMLSMSPDIVVAFPGGAGTRMMVDIANKAKVDVWDLRGLIG